MKIVVDANEKTLKITEGEKVEFESSLADTKLEIIFNCTHCSWNFINDLKRDHKG